MLTQQDDGGPWESFHARDWWKLSYAERLDVLSHLQRHSHHGHHVIQHMWDETWGVANIYITIQIRLFSDMLQWKFGWEEYSCCKTHWKVLYSLYLSLIQDKGDFLAFENEINSFELPSEIIVRRKEVKIEFFCQFPKTISISSYYNLHKSDYIFTESSFGSFGYTFEIYSNSNFTDKVPPTAYPVEVKLLDTIYMGIQAESQLPNVTLFVESCKATPDDNPDNSLSYDIIKNGWVLMLSGIDRNVF